MALVVGVAGEGTTSGFASRRIEVHVMLTRVERARPGLDRSRMYQRAGFTRERVTETWSVDCQGSLRFRETS